MKDAGKNLAGNQQFTFEGTLLSVGTTVLQNSNKKNYKIANIEFADVNGVIQTATAAIYEGNYSKGIKVGKEYLTTATIVGDKAWLQMSHLVAGAGVATVSMFLASVEVASTTKVGSLAS